MNIEKLAKHLKEFTLDEIEMIAEDDCKTEIERLLNEHKLSVNKGFYKYVEKQKEEYSIFINKKSKKKNYEFTVAVHDFLENYAKKYCKIATYNKYRQQFKYDITPYFEKLKINDITVGNIKNYYKRCKDMGFKSLKIKNTLALVKQF